MNNNNNNDTFENKDLNYMTAITQPSKVPLALNEKSSNNQMSAAQLLDNDDVLKDEDNYSDSFERHEQTPAISEDIKEEIVVA